ncbi:MAG: hypothetical protein AAF570_19010, partial [Bacteroidota bacterium]
VVLGADPQWALWGSYPIDILDHDRVKLEAASHELMLKYGTPVVAVSFNEGLGQVYHVISHFWAKNSATPTTTHREPYDVFLAKGMGLGPESVADIVKESGISTDSVNFGMLQSAATAMELAATLCIRAMKMAARTNVEKAGTPAA